MIILYWWQIVAAVVVIMAGVYWIVERRIAKNNETISEYMQIKDDKMRGFMGSIVDSVKYINEEYEEELMLKLRESMDSYKNGIAEEIIGSLREFYGRNQEDTE